jgi:hypothetical protein
MKHTVAYSVTFLTKNHVIAIKGIFLPSSLQNDGKRGIYLALNSNCNKKPGHVHINIKWVVDLNGYLGLSPHLGGIISH